MALSCKHVDDVVIGAPFILTEDLIKSLNIHKVVNVISKDDYTEAFASDEEQADYVDPFACAKSMGLYHELAEDPEEMTVEVLAKRVEKN